VSFLLDTNVVSEWVKPRPDPGVIAWLGEVDEDRVFLSVVTLAELRYGIVRLTDGTRRRRLDAWLSHELLLRFEGRLLLIDQAVADRWGEIVVRREAAGRPIGAMDAFIAATAHVHQLTLVTRNEADFRSAVEDIVNPWIGSTR
jgi:predicted nucleic acid-binding protein